MLQWHSYAMTNIAVRPTSEADVSVIVKAAKDANMPISIRRWAKTVCNRETLQSKELGPQGLLKHSIWTFWKWCACSGGHSYTCTNIKQDSVHLDMRGMDSIQLTEVMIRMIWKGRRKIHLDVVYSKCKELKIFLVIIHCNENITVYKLQDSSSPTGLAAVLEPGATWGNVRRFIQRAKKLTK